MNKVLIVGAGGHGQVVADILLQTSQAGGGCCPIGFLDDDPSLLGKHVLGLPVLGTVAQWNQFEHDGLIVAIGNNQIRSRIFQSLRSRGGKLLSAVHPAAVLGREVQIGEGVMICAGVVVNPGAAIGDNVILNTGCTVDHHCQIAPHAHLGPGVHLGGQVAIGEGAFLGIGACVLPQRQVGAWSVIGAGAVVTENIPAYVTAVGIPARVVKPLTEANA